MKKAKPTKGSARTRKFASGGDIAALAGLGTLAYLLSRKKDKDKDEGGLKVGSGESTPKPVIKSMQSEDERFKGASEGESKEPPEPEKSKVYKAEPSTTPAKPTNTPAAKSAPAKRASQAFPLTNSRTDTTSATSTPKASQQFPLSSSAGKSNEDLPSKPYPAKEAAARKAEAEKKSKGMGPRLTFLTPERLDKSKEAMRRAREGMKKGGAVKKYASGGSVSSASKRADGIAQRGKTRGKVL